MIQRYTLLAHVAAKMLDVHLVYAITKRFESMFFLICLYHPNAIWFSISDAKIIATINPEASLPVITRAPEERSEKSKAYETFPSQETEKLFTKLKILEEEQSKKSSAKHNQLKKQTKNTEFDCFSLLKEKIKSVCPA